MANKIVVLDGYTLNPGDISWEPFKQLGDLTVYPRSRGQVAERAAAAPIVITNKDILSADVIDQLPDLEYIGVTATGTNIVDLQAATQRGIVVTNAPAYGPDSVAQHTIALLLELTNRVAAHSEAVHDGLWATCPDFSFTLQPIVGLSRKTMGIIGLGAIGGRVARIAAALGMRIIAADTREDYCRDVPGVDVGWRTLDAFFAEADVVSLHCPLKAESEYLVDAQRLAQMKGSALLINCSRGPLIDETALADALAEGRLAGAAVDVLSTEPPVDGSPLIEQPRCLVTPHLAWAAIDARLRLMKSQPTIYENFWPEIQLTW